MAAPWEKYQSAEKPDSVASKPWEKYSKPSEEKGFLDTAGKTAIEFAEPTIEALGTIGGGFLGTPLGPLGTVGGAGLGYGIAKEVTGGLKRMAGYEPERTGAQKITQPIENILTGATYEAGGRALPELLRAGSKIGQSVGDMLRSSTPKVKAAKIASEALGENLPQARQILKSASDDISASQALATIDPKTGRAILDAPTAQALLKRAEARDPEFFTKMFGQQDAARLKQLQQIAGGANQTEARAAQEELKKQLNEKLIPTLKTELEAANLAGQKLPKLRGEAERMEGAAANKVQDVRRFTAAQPRAEALARSNLIEKGQPVGATKYTYIGGDLQRKAEQVAADAAEGSLRFGEAARFARAAEQSLAAHGLKPLEGDAVISSINKKLSDPSFAGNDEIRNSLIKVAQDIRQWTNKGGVIDAFALDSIRKNSVNSAIQKMYPQASKQAQKALSAKVLESVKPAIIDAIEGAGGTGYRQYLVDYTLGSQKIAQTKLGGELLNLYQTSPQNFVKYVEGNAPEAIESNFGPGSYNIFKEMSRNTQQRLGKIAGEIKREGIIGEQAQAGTQRLADVLNTNLGLPRLPFFSPKSTVTNKALASIEDKVSKGTWEALKKASRSAKDFEELLSNLPEPNRKEAIKAINATSTAGGALAGMGANLDNKGQ